MNFNDELIYTGKGHREVVYSGDVNTPRIRVSDLAEHICKVLGFEPDVKKLETAKMMLGVGSYHRLTTEAWIANLPEGKEVRE